MGFSNDCDFGYCYFDLIAALKCDLCCCNGRSEHGCDIEIHRAVYWISCRGVASTHGDDAPMKTSGTNYGREKLIVSSFVQLQNWQNLLSANTHKQT